MGAFLIAKGLRNVRKGPLLLSGTWMTVVLAALIYLLITSASNVVLRWLERHYAAGSREAVR
jgi:ABC-type arginine transport system permease subunit